MASYNVEIKIESKGKGKKGYRISLSSDGKLVKEKTAQTWNEAEYWVGHLLAGFNPNNKTCSFTFPLQLIGINAGKP